MPRRVGAAAHPDHTAGHYNHVAAHNDNTPVHADHDALLDRTRNASDRPATAYRSPAAGAYRSPGRDDRRRPFSTAAAR